MTVKFANGRKIDVFKDIWIYYLKNNFGVDFISFLILVIDVAFTFQGIGYLRLFVIFKLPQCLDKI